MDTLREPPRRVTLQCDKADSVLAAIEAAWKLHHARKPGFSVGLYQALAIVLNDEGMVIDTLDGLDILEHCRRRNLPIVDILHTLETKVRQASYRGDRLCLADFYVGSKPMYAFYDGARFDSFVDLKQKAQMRIAVPPAVEHGSTP